MSIAFLFPGRGSQRPGMLHRLPDTAAAATVLAEADHALRTLAARTGGEGSDGSGTGRGSGREYADGIVELDSQEALERSPVACHLALLIAGVAGARALIEDEEVRPAYVAGYDAGGYAAAVLAEVLTFEEALRAVRLRGELLHGAEAANAPQSDVAIRLAQHLATIKRRPQSVPYVGGLQGRSLLGDTNAVFDDLAWSVARPVRWEEATSALAEKVGCCVELPPGRALSGQLAAQLPGVRAVSVEEHGIAVAAELARSASAGGAAGGSAPGPGDPYPDALGGPYPGAPGGPYPGGSGGPYPGGPGGPYPGGPGGPYPGTSGGGPQQDQSGLA